MPFDPKRYPENWKQISHEIRFVRAGGKCEKCGVKHGAIGTRDKDANWYDSDYVDKMDPDEAYSMFGERIYKFTKIILTVHHIGIDYPDGSPGDCHDKMDVRPANLISLCQRCHLKADMPIHIANRKATYAKRRAEKIAATGQQSFLEGN